MALPRRVARGQASDACTFVYPKVKDVANLGCHQTDNYATNKGTSINFNNQAGLLSSMTPEQLFANSVQSGLAKCAGT
ncbi:MAG: major capsid protein V20 domain-containing protein, partial [Candidatus Fonsibacter sp.]